jgi:DNA invertase Pin-like site-specific DNA recombinase
MSRISPEHLARAAFVYVRQSSVYQVLNNLESQRRQYGLAERARQLGWEDVQIVDDDLGRSGAGTPRPGFEKLLAAICEGRVGAVVSLEASRLARNGRDWNSAAWSIRSSLMRKPSMTHALPTTGFCSV